MDTDFLNPAQQRIKGRPGGGALVRVYLTSVVALLILTAAAKLVMALGGAQALDLASPVFGFLSNRELICLAAGLELAVAVTMLRGRSEPRLGVGTVAGLATVFLGYRFLLWAKGFHGYCQCLGNISGGIGLAPARADAIAWGILLYFLGGSYGILLALRSRPAARKVPATVGGVEVPQEDSRRSTISQPRQGVVEPETYSP